MKVKKMEIFPNKMGWMGCKWFILNVPGGQFNRHLKFKAWVKDKVEDAFRKALDREMVKAWVKAWVKAVQNVY